MVLPDTIEDPPSLQSFKRDQNDQTGEKGYWMNDTDAYKEAAFRGGVAGTIKEFREKKK